MKKKKKKRRKKKDERLALLLLSDTLICFFVLLFIMWIYVYFALLVGGEEGVRCQNIYIPNDKCLCTWLLTFPWQEVSFLQVVPALRFHWANGGSERQHHSYRCRHLRCWCRHCLWCCWGWAPLGAWRHRAWWYRAWASRAWMPAGSPWLITGDGGWIGAGG